MSRYYWRPMSKDKKLLLVFPLVFLALQLLILETYGGNLSEGWFSDIAYHLNWEFNGQMAKDIPYGSSWNSGIGKLFFFIHYIFYKIFGIGLFQARLVTFVSGAILLILLYRWTVKYVSQEIAIFSTLLLGSSPLFYLSLPDARQDVMHCLFAFFSFFLISIGVLKSKNIYFILAGFFSAMAVDISYRGVEIVVAVYIFHCIYFKRETFLKRSALLLSGSFIFFVYWISVNVMPMGIGEFRIYNLTSVSEDGGVYSIKTLFSEVNRFLRLFSGKGKYILGIEIGYLIFLSIISYRYWLKYKAILKVLLSWLLVCFFIMSLFEKTEGRSYLLIYYPVICIFSGIGLYELFEHKKKSAYITLIAIIFSASVFQGGRFILYSYHTYIKRDFDPEGYNEKLRSSVGLNKNIIGATNHWYAFPDAQYYGGQFYLSRVMQVLKEFKPPNEYKNDYERAYALLNVFEKRKIEYIIADEYFKPTIIQYFTNNELPSKNFLLVNTITDMFLGKGNESKKPPYTTEIYKVISYEP